MAYSKIGNFDKAIEVIQRKEKIQPGLYETYSNLGTFYILAGRFKEGLPYIDKALAINPDAHFGREKYQKYLVEYVLEKMANKNQLTFPLGSLGTKSNEKDSKFRPWLLTPKPADYNSISREDAIKGVLGMMRFADYKNPILLEALGDLLWIQTFERWPENIPHDGKLLAARAYLQASYQMKDDVQREEYRKIATAALYLKSERSVESIEPQFLEEIADAEKWYEELRLKEIGWIKAGLDVEAEFDKLYDREPQVKGDFWELLTKDISQDDFLLASIICFFFFVLLFFLFCIVAYRRVRRWRSRRNSLPG
ncbi:tetratricopeptide repeat protein [Telmatocola sphagniphila]|uniref:Tetratricopeptide repeat protein n=1 Tax=Telmatocola sphagniphila TaxID=1123043 RepID=A0A8E6B3R4_9BACT|nr:tetratricopeptide repeat protein [Telmatocola sphagniphila]QVL30899.1 tetratricopeptide repeat protein [Telmatocola sphagniphila]